jgi:DNA (cytosine-5)-methyltransferase 1
MKVYPAITGALCANSHPGSYTGQDAFNNMLPVIERKNNDRSVHGREWATGSDPAAYRITDAGLHARSENGNSQKFHGGGTSLDGNRKYVLRRLTPTECARLQGFPDWWCDGANGSDSAQYKLWGNGVALPCVAMILQNIAEDAKRGKEKNEDRQTV